MLAIDQKQKGYIGKYLEVLPKVFWKNSTTSLQRRCTDDIFTIHNLRRGHPSYMCTQMWYIYCYMGKDSWLLFYGHYKNNKESPCFLPHTPKNNTTKHIWITRKIFSPGKKHIINPWFHLSNNILRYRRYVNQKPSAVSMLVTIDFLIFLFSVSENKWRQLSKFEKHRVCGNNSYLILTSRSSRTRKKKNHDGNS